eukprot:1047294-Pleurochrysis_carterae.AAC.1
MTLTLTAFKRCRGKQVEHTRSTRARAFTTRYSCPSHELPLPPLLTLVVSRMRSWCRGCRALPRCLRSRSRRWSCACTAAPTRTGRPSSPRDARAQRGWCCLAASRRAPTSTRRASSSTTPSGALRACSCEWVHAHARLPKFAEILRVEKASVSIASAGDANESEVSRVVDVLC